MLARVLLHDILGGPSGFIRRLLPRLFPRLVGRRIAFFVAGHNVPTKAALIRYRRLTSQATVPIILFWSNAVPNRLSGCSLFISLTVLVPVKTDKACVDSYKVERLIWLTRANSCLRITRRAGRDELIATPTFLPVHARARYFALLQLSILIG